MMPSFPTSLLERLNAEIARLEHRNADAWVPILERLKGTIGDDGIERIGTAQVLDILKIPPVRRRLGTHLRLTKVMVELGWTAARVGGINHEGTRVQAKGFFRDARNKPVATPDEKRAALPANLMIWAKRHPPELKARAVEMVEGGAHPAMVARELGVGVQSVRNWCGKAAVEFPDGRQTEAARERGKRHRAKVAEAYRARLARELRDQFGEVPLSTSSRKKGGAQEERPAPAASAPVKSAELPDIPEFLRR